jgi:hypothetical protein
MAFFTNLFIFMIPVAIEIDFSITKQTMPLIISSVIIYSILFEIFYNIFLKKRIKEIHDLIDKVVYSINNNFKDPNKS